MGDDGRRRVFRYFDGSGEAYADPVAVYRRFMEAVDGNPDPLLEAARTPGDDPPAVLRRLGAEQRLADVARAALPMRPFDPATGGGATEGDCLEALYAWLEWMEGNAGGGGSTATSPAPTAPVP